MSGTSAGNRPKKPTAPHKAVIAHARSMKRVLAAIVTAWDVRATIREVVEEIPRESAPLPGGLRIAYPDGTMSEPGAPYQYIEKVYADRKRRADEYPQALSGNWDDLLRAATHLRDQADKLARYAQQQGRRTREYDYVNGVIPVTRIEEE